MMASRCLLGLVAMINVKLFPVVPDPTRTTGTSQVSKWPSLDTADNILQFCKIFRLVYT